MKTRGIELRRAIVESAVVKNSLALISGTIATQAIVFLFSPVLSRIFGLADFGDLANYNAWVAFLAVLSNLRYEQAVFVTKERVAMTRVMALAAWLSIVSCLGYAAIAGAIYVFYRGGGYVGELRRVVLFIPVGVFAVCVVSLLMQFNVKSGMFRRLAVVTTIQAIFTVIPQIVLGLMRIPDALIVGTIVGYGFAGAVFAWLYVSGNGSRGLLNEMMLRPMWRTAREYLNFPRYALAADAIGVIVQQFVPVFVLALFNPAIAGLYAFSIRVVRVPLIVISTAVTSALRKEAGDQVHAGDSLFPLFLTTVRSLTVLSLVPFGIVLLFGDRLFGIVFGAQWAQAGHLVQILSPGILLEFVALPMSAFFLVTNNQRYTFAVQSAGFVLMVAALFAGKHLIRDFTGTCYLVSGAMIIVNLLGIAMAARVSGPRRRAEAALAA